MAALGCRKLPPGGEARKEADLHTSRRAASLPRLVGAVP